MTNRTCNILFAAILLCCAAFAHGQVSVAIAPDPHPQFVDGSGKPLAGGFLYTYQAGTTTLLNTYVDSSGIVQNPDPIPLDSTGAPTNGSTQTGIWLANTAYKFCAYNTAFVQQWCVDNVTGYLGLLNLANTWSFQQTFTLPIIDTAIDNQIVLGVAGNKTTLDFPPPSSNIVLHYPNTADTIVARATTDSLSNKTLLLPLFNSSGCAIVNGPGTYICVANANPTGTTLNDLSKLINAPGQVTITATTDTSGIQGICVAGCGNTGTATIQQSGQASCTFDGATTSNDYVQPSSSVAGDCHDAGAVKPASGQVLGQVLSTNGSGGVYAMVLSGGGGAGTQTVCADASTTTVNANVTSNQVLKTCPLASAALNSLNKTFRVTANVTVSPNSVLTSNVTLGFGATGAPFATNITVATQAASSAGWQIAFTFLCSTSAAGATGTLSCTNMPTPSSFSGIAISSLNPGIGPVNLTGPIFMGVSCSFSVASALNTCNTTEFLVEQLN